MASASDLPYGLPDFDSLTPALLAEAIREGCARQRAEWEDIAQNAESATVETVLEPIEQSGALLRRAGYTFAALASSLGGQEYDELDEELSSLLASHVDEFYLDERIYARLVALKESGAELSADTAWLLDTYLKDFRRAGVDLTPDDQARLRELNARIATLQSQFGRKVVAAIGSHALPVTQADLAGLDQRTRESLRQEDGSWRIPLQSPTQQPISASLADADTRARLYEASASRNWGEEADTDTRQIVLELARARAERAQLLGYDHHADYVAEDGAAATSQAIMERLLQLAGPAARNARAEEAELAELMSQEDPRTFAISDWSYYSEKLRAKRFQLDDASMRPYLELDRVLTDGVFFAAHELYGLSFREREDLRGFAPDVRIWEVSDANGEGIALFVGDYFARPGKKGGAWMTSLVEQNRLRGEKPIVLNCLNITPPAAGEPALLTWDEVRTCFHEFGHALHGICSDVYWPSQSGTSVPRDFVEYPSQLNEMWMDNARVIRNFARHYETGEPMPESWIETLRSLGSYGEGFATSEYLGAALLDQAWHRLSPTEVPSDISEVERFEARVLREFGIDVVPPRYRSTYFAHTFAGGYDAGYYSYVWSEVFDADTVTWFRTEANDGADGGLNRAAGQRFRTEVLSRGNSREPMTSVRALLRREPRLDPLLERRGLA